MNNETTNIGIFFKVGSNFLIDAVPLAEGEPYGDAIGYSGHYDFHENFEPSTPPEHRFKAHDYDYYPRGRVVCFPKRNSFTLYADPCLTADDISRIICLFALDGQTVEVAGDEHYRCSTCNKSYLE
jgi:hypothetical protein